MFTIRDIYGPTCVQKLSGSKLNLARAAENRVVMKENKTENMHAPKNR